MPTGEPSWELAPGFPVSAPEQFCELPSRALAAYAGWPFFLEYQGHSIA